MSPPPRTSGQAIGPGQQAPAPPPNPARRHDRTPTVLGRTHHQARRPLAAPGGDRLLEPAVGLSWFAVTVGPGARAGHLAGPLHQRCRPGSTMIPLESHGASEMACCGALDFDGTRKGRRHEKGVWTSPARWTPWLCGSCCRGAGPSAPSAGRCRGRLGRVRLLQGAEGVEVGDARLRRAAVADDEHLAFGTVDM